MLVVQDQPCAADSLYRACAGQTEFASDGVQVDVDSAGVVLKTLSPDMVEDIVAAAQAVRMLHQVRQQRKLQRSQVDGSSFALDRVRGAIQFNMSYAKIHISE